MINSLYEMIKVASRVENTEVIKKGCNFANRTYFASCVSEKTLFSIMDERKGA